MNSFLEKLQNTREAKNTLLCFGMDPVVERMKIDTSKSLSDEIVGYFSRILNEIAPKVTAVKPNIGFYMQYGFEGMKALQKLIERAKEIELPVIIDAKIGDIGKTSLAYAKYVFEVLDGDAVTLSPYMGYDSLEPFFSYKEKGFFILALTSNPGARDFQFIELKSGKRLYEHVIESVCMWSKDHNSVGAVIGATQDRSERCIEAICATGKPIPLLVPGVGTQGGSYQKIDKMLEKNRYNRGIVRINASSSISYAHERFPSFSIEEAAYLAIEEILKS